MPHRMESRAGPRYTSFAWVASSLLVVRAALHAVVAVGLHLRLLEVSDIEGLPSAFLVDHCEFLVGSDLRLLGWLAPVAVMARVAHTRSLASFFFGALGGIAGLALAMAISALPALIIRGYLPAIGIAPNTWVAALLFTALALALINAPLVFMRWRSHGRRRLRESGKAD